MVAKPIRRNKLLEFFASLPRCLVGFEASGSAHHWARELIKLGHDARMMPPAYVKPYIRRQKNDASDAAAICEAVTRPSMRFVGVRSLENQAALMRHKAREMLVSQRTQLVNGLRGQLFRGRRHCGAGAPTRPRTGRADRGLRRDESRLKCARRWRRSWCNCESRRSDRAARPNDRKAGAEGRNGPPADRAFLASADRPPRRWRRPYRIRPVSPARASSPPFSG